MLGDAIQAAPRETGEGMCKVTLKGDALAK